MNECDCLKASTLTPVGDLNMAYKYSAADWPVLLKQDILAIFLRG